MIIVTYYPDSTGHIALVLTGLGEDNIYISFFPPNFSSIGGFRLHYLADDRRHGAAVTVILPSEESCGYGLSEKAVYDWWKNAFKPSHEAFSWFTNNCAVIVYRALQEGLHHSSSLTTFHHSKKKIDLATPGRVITYASELGEALLAQCPDVNQTLMLQYADIQQLCALGKLRLENAYLETFAIYRRLNQFKNNEYSLAVIQAFCVNIRKLLNAFSKQIKLFLDKGPTLNHFLLLCATDKLDSGDLASHFNHLKKITDDLYINTNQFNQSMLPIWQTMIQQYVLNELNSYISHIQKSTLVESAQINYLLNEVNKKINNEKNPHSAYHQTGDEMPHQYTYSR